MTKPDLAKKLFELITTSDLNEKISIGKHFNTLTATSIEKLDTNKLNELKKPGRPEGFESVAPTSVPKRGFQTEEARAQFLHAIANIELLAIELPALCLLRYGSDNLEFIAKQLQVIAEEAKHFSLLSKRLLELNTPFGSLPTHLGLWDQAWKCSSELEHQTIIPCYLEARGLDVSPNFAKKFKAVDDLKSAEILQIIIDEEIHHVRFGMEYLNQKAKEQGLTSDELFEKTLKGFFGDSLKSRVGLNIALRKQAGFSNYQIEILEP